MAQVLESLDTKPIQALYGLINKLYKSKLQSQLLKLFCCDTFRTLVRATVPGSWDIAFAHLDPLLYYLFSGKPT